MRVTRYFKSCISRLWQDHRAVGSLLVLSLVLVFFVPKVCSANIATDWLTDFLVDAAKGLIGMGLFILAKGLRYTNFIAGNPAVAEVWKSVKNLALSLFGLAILVIAIMNLLRVDISTWGASRLIPKLFLAAFAVLFSKFFCLSMINLSNALASSILGFLNMNDFLSNPDGFIALYNNYDNINKSQVGATTGTVLFIIGVAVFACFIMLAFFLILRAALLGFMIILAPLAFAFLALPWTEKMAMSWLSQFIKWVFFLPICLLIMGIGLKISITAVANSGRTSLTPETKKLADQGALNDPLAQAAKDEMIPAVLQGEDADDSGGSLTDTTSPSNTFATFILLLTGIISIPLSIYMPFKMLGKVGEYFQSVMKGTGGPNIWGSPKRMKGAWDRREKARQARREAKPSYFGNNKVGQFISGFDKAGMKAKEDKWHKAHSETIDTPEGKKDVSPPYRWHKPWSQHQATEPEMSNKQMKTNIVNEISTMRAGSGVTSLENSTAVGTKESKVATVGTLTDSAHTNPHTTPGASTGGTISPPIRHTDSAPQKQTTTTTSPTNIKRPPNTPLP